MPVQRADLDRTIRRAISESSSTVARFEDLSVYNGVLGHTLGRTVRDVTDMLDGGKVLEIGFFTGVVSVSLANLGYKVTGSDIPFVANDTAVRDFLEKNRVRVIPWDLKDDPPAELDGSQFDLIVFTEVIEHLPFNAIPLLQKLRDLLRPEGILYCATPNLAHFRNRLKLLLGQDTGFPVSHLIASLTPESGASVGLHWREYTRQSLVELFATAGFELAAHRYVQMNPAARNRLVSLAKSALFKLAPALMEGQVACFRRPAEASPTLRMPG